MKTEIKVGKYRHFKGKEYRVLGVGRHSETLEECVIYQALYDSPEFGPNAIWIRPVSDFVAIIERDGKAFPRFEFIG